MNEPEPGRLAVWRVECACDALRLEIDLDCDQTVLLTIDRDGHATAQLAGNFAPWLEAESQPAS